MFGLAGSEMLEVWREMGLRPIGEGFADRRYEPDGTLRNRKFPDALITDPASAAAGSDWTGSVMRCSSRAARCQGE